MAFRYEVTTTPAELAHDESFMKYLLLDGLRSQAEIMRLQHQKREQKNNRHHIRDIIRECTQLERSRQYDDHLLIEGLVRKYGRQIILTDSDYSEEWGTDKIQGTYQGIDFTDGSLAISTASGVEEVEFADMRFDVDNGMSYTPHTQVTFPSRLVLTPAQYKADSQYLPSLES